MTSSLPGLRLSCSALLLGLLGFATAHAANPGDFDPTFGGGAEVVTFDELFGGFDEAYDVALFPDGSVALAGNVQTSAVADVEPDPALAKVGANGVQTNGWGDLNDGRTLLTFDAPGVPKDESLYDVAVDADGRVVAAGWRFDASQSPIWKTIVIRLDSNGDPDPTFTSDGMTFLTLSGASAGLGIDSQGRIVIATTDQASSGSTHVARFQVNPAGEGSAALDTTFDTDGFVQISQELGGDLLVLPDDRILVATRPQSSLGVNYVRLRLYTTAGGLDPSFGGGDGVAEIYFGTVNDRSGLSELALDPRGRFVALGSYQNPTSHPVIARILPNGVLDDSFGGDGIIELGVDADTTYDATDVAVQTDGKVIVVGFESGSSTIGRFHDNGNVDGTFGVVGFRSFFYESPVDTASAWSVATGPDGRIVVAGGSSNDNDPGNVNFAVARFESGVVFCDGFESEGIYGVSRWSLVAP